MIMAGNAAMVKSILGQERTRSDLLMTILSSIYPIFCI